MAPRVLDTLRKKISSWFMFVKTLAMLSFIFVLFICLAIPTQAGVSEWVGNGPQSTIVYSIATSPDYSSDKTIYAGTDIGVYRSTNGGQSWTLLGLTDNCVLSLAISPNFSTDETLFAGSYDALYRSTDGGSTWEDCSPVEADYATVAVSPQFSVDQTVFAGTSGDGLFKSTDSGLNWSSASLSGKYVSSIAVSATFSADHTAFASTSDGNGIYKTTNSGSTWISSGLGGSYIKSIAMSPQYSSDDTIFAGSYMSDDAGATWSSNWESDADIFSLVVSPSYSSDDSVFAGTYGDGVYKSTDNGGTWTQINTDLSSTYVSSLEISPAYSTDHQLFSGTWGYGVFSCITQSDIWSPTVVTADPTANSTSVARSKTISITFNEKIQAGTAYNIITLKDANNNQITATKGITGRILTIDPSSDLAYGTTYTVIIPAGAVKDTAGNSLAAQYSLPFVTLSTPDTTAPTVSSTDPTASATGVAKDKTIAITFSEAIVAGTAYGSIAMTGPSSTQVAFTKSINGAVLSINPNTDLTYGLQYTVTIPLAAVKDSSNNNLAAQSTLSFTVQTDTTAPTVLSTTPATNSTTMTKDETMTVTFSETVQSGTAYETIALKDADNKAVAMTKTLSGAVLTLDPSGSLTPGAAYSLTIPASAVKDSANNTLASQTVVTFTVKTETGGPAAPQGLRYSSTTDTIELNWTANQEQSIKGYFIYKRTKDSTSTATKLNTTPLNALTYQDKAVEKGKTYVYYITAVDSLSRESQKSTELEAIVGGTSSAFKDIPAGAWYGQYVATLVAQNIISGYTDGNYRPNNKVTRGEFAKIICLAMGWELENPTKATFKDVSTTNWAYKYIETAKKHEVIGGYKDGSFQQTKSITRAEIAKIIAQTLQLTGGTSSFKDTSKSWALEYIKACAKAGIIGGYPDNTFKPSNSASRAETAKIVVGIIGQQ